MLHVFLPRILGLSRRFGIRTIPLFLLAIFPSSPVSAQTATTSPATCQIASAVFEPYHHRQDHNNSTRSASAASRFLNMGAQLGEAFCGFADASNCRAAFLKLVFPSCCLFMFAASPARLLADANCKRPRPRKPRTGEMNDRDGD